MLIKRSVFSKAKLENIGHVISSDGVAANESKIEAMKTWRSLRSLCELRRFLGLTGYCRRFVKGYSSIAWPLTKQLKKDAFCWTKAAEVALQQLKAAMTMLLVLALLNFSQLFVVEADASGRGLGAVLMKNQRPIAYFSQVLSQRAWNKSIYERELITIVLVIQKWCHYLLGRRFLVRNYQKSLSSC